MCINIFLSMLWEASLNKTSVRISERCAGTLVFGSWAACANNRWRTSVIATWKSYEQTLRSWNFNIHGLWMSVQELLGGSEWAYYIVEGRQLNLQNRDRMLDQGPSKNGGQTVRDRILCCSQSFFTVWFGIAVCCVLFLRFPGAAWLQPLELCIVRVHLLWRSKGQKKLGTKFTFIEHLGCFHLHSSWCLLSMSVVACQPETCSLTETCSLRQAQPAWQSMDCPVSWHRKLCWSRLQSKVLWTKRLYLQNPSKFTLFEHMWLHDTTCGKYTRCDYIACDCSLSMFFFWDQMFVQFLLAFGFFNDPRNQGLGGPARMDVSTGLWWREGFRCGTFECPV